VTVNGSAATVNSSHYFSGTASLTPGTTATVPVVATDSLGNTRTNHYQTAVPAEPTYSPTFDNDGNELTSGAGQTYTWDALNELASITYTGGASTVFTYDALGRRISIVEKNSGGTVTSTKQLVWDGSTVAEERNVSNTVTKRFYAQGEQISGTSYYYTRDHLGSVREMVDNSGTIQARYDYDPYGRVTKVSGSMDSDFQYAGYYEHATSGLNLTLFRAYDPIAARWLSRDPISGTNLYAYVGNNPIGWLDPQGLCKVEIRYNQIGSIPGLGPYYHSYVVTTDPSGAQTYYRAGPSGGGPSGGSSGQLSGGSSGSGSATAGGSSSPGSSGSGNSTSPGATPNGGGNNGSWGPIQAESGPYVPGTVDWNPNPTSSQTLEDDGKPCGCGGAMQNYVNQVNSSNIPYNPFNTNSNAFATGAAQAGGFSPGPAPVWAPGSTTTLPVH
jgi:RHS repeat-associated protein